MNTLEKHKLKTLFLKKFECPKISATNMVYNQIFVIDQSHIKTCWKDRIVYKVFTVVLKVQKPSHDF